MERSKVRDNVFGFFAGNFTESGYGIGQVNDFTAGVNGRKHSREYAAFCYYAGDDKMPGFFCGFYNLRDMAELLAKQRQEKEPLIRRKDARQFPVRYSVS